MFEGFRVAHRQSGLHLKSALLSLTAIALLAAISLPARAGDDRAIKSRVAPIYPEVAKRMHVQGEVKLIATVDASGKVTDVKEVSGNHMLTIAAEDAVKMWRFEPGPAVDSVPVSVNFALAQ